MMEWIFGAVTAAQQVEDELTLLSSVDQGPQTCPVCGSICDIFGQCFFCEEEAPRWEEAQAGETDFGPYSPSTSVEDGGPIKLFVDIKWPQLP